LLRDVVNDTLYQRHSFIYLGRNNDAVRFVTTKPICNNIAFITSKFQTDIALLRLSVILVVGDLRFSILRFCEHFLNAIHDPASPSLAYSFHDTRIFAQAFGVRPIRSGQKRVRSM